MKAQKQEHEFELSKVSERSLVTIGRAIKYLQFYYHNTNTINTYEEMVLPTNQFPFIIKVDEGMTFEIFKNNAFLWMTKKVVEDYILGINLSLIELNKLILIKEFADSTVIKPIQSKEEYVSKLSKIDKQVNGMSLPEMLRRVRNWIGDNLYLEKEILSINKLRACLAHRNGMVNKLKDANDNTKESLIISWQEYETEVKLTNNKWEKMNFALRKNGVEVKDARYEIVERMIKFKDGEEIKLDLDILNGLGITCIMFTQQLYEVIKKKFGK